MPREEEQRTGNDCLRKESTEQWARLERNPHETAAITLAWG